MFHLHCSCCQQIFKLVSWLPQLYQLLCEFWECSSTQENLVHATALHDDVFLYTCVLTYKSCTTQKYIKRTRFKRFSQTPLFKESWCCITPWHCQDKVPRPLHLHNNHFEARTWCRNFWCWTHQEEIKAIIVPANSSISLPPILLIVRDREWIVSQKF